jgi:hypothetical protein
MIRPRNARGWPSGRPGGAEPSSSFAAQSAAVRTAAGEVSRRRWLLPIVSRRAYERDVLEAFNAGWTRGLRARYERGAA